MAYVRQLSKVSFYSSIFLSTPYFRFKVLLLLLVRVGIFQKVNIVKRSTATCDALDIADSCSPIY